MTFGEGYLSVRDATTETLGGKEMVLLRLINYPEVTGCLGWLGLLEVATQCDVELGRDYVLEQWNLVSSWSV